jgi:hypothetical protein
MEKFILRQEPSHEPRNNRDSFYEEIILANSFIEEKKNRCESTNDILVN